MIRENSMAAIPAVLLRFLVVLPILLLTTGCGDDNESNPTTSTVALTATNISPNEGSILGGTMVTITGTGFVAVPTVSLGGIAATNVNILSTTSLTAMTSAHAAGSVNVVVTNPDGKSDTITNGFTYVALSVTSLNPAVGFTTGGTSVTFAGNGFQTNATVTFGGASATSVAVSGSTSLTATAPAHAAGQVNVVVTNPNGESDTVANGFTYVLPGLTVTNIDPDRGTTLGSTMVTITGTGFVNPTATFGGLPVTDINISSTTSFTAMTPAHDAGPVDVIVTNSGGAADTVTNGFTYVAPTQLEKSNWIVDLTYLGGDFRIEADLVQDGNDLTGDFFYSSGGTNFQVNTDGMIFGDSIDVTFTLDQGTAQEASFRCIGQLFSSSPQTFTGDFTALSGSGTICGGVSPCEGTFEIR